LWEGQKDEGRGQEAEGRRMRAEGRRQRAEGRRMRAEGRRQRAEGRRMRAEGRREKGAARLFQRIISLQNYFFKASSSDRQLRNRGAIAHSKSIPPHRRRL
jgi:hypothetical protein